jgi:hypothetical protein
MKLCASRAFWLVAYPSQGHEMLFDAHTRSFAALGGVARRGIYDNMKTAVDKVKKGKGRVVNARFARCARTTCSTRLLQRRQRLGEGRRREERAGQPPSHLDRGGPSASAALPSSTPGWASAAGLCGGAAPPRAQSSSAWPRCWSTSGAPDADAVRLRRLRREPGRVSSTCLVTVARNRYSVPCELGGQMVSTRLYPGADRGRGGATRSWPTHERLSDRKGRPLRLAALHPAAAEEARRAAQRRALCWTCPSRCSAAQGLAAPGGRRPRDGAGAGQVPVARAGRRAGGGGAGAGEPRRHPGGSAPSTSSTCWAGCKRSPGPRRLPRHLQVSQTAAGRHGALRQPARGSDMQEADHA